MRDHVSVTTVTSILLVDAMEPCLKFWHAIGFTTGMTVPNAAPFVFAILNHGTIEVMLQTRASAAEDVPALAESVQASVLYVGVTALAPIMAALADAPVVVPRRTTFYGADEIFLRDPAGNVIGFSAPA